MIAQNIDEVVAILDCIIAEYRERRSTLVFFPALYRAVTLRVRAGIRAGNFIDGQRMDQLGTQFANRYFDAVNDWQSGREPSRAWQEAFNAETRPNMIILQHLLLGINAHINLDLPIATVDVASNVSLSNLESDFQAINELLGSLLDPGQAVINQFSPVLNVLDCVGGRTDETIINFSITNARDEAWHEATRLASETDARRARSIVSLDRRVTLLAKQIATPSGPVGLAIDLIALTESHDVPTVVDALLTITSG